MRFLWITAGVLLAAAVTIGAGFVATELVINGVGRRLRHDAQ